MKAFKSYNGGKEGNGTYQAIINKIRPHDLFFEPFGGNFAISRKLKSNSEKHINDKSIRVYTEYLKLKPSSFHFYNFDYKEFFFNVIYPVMALKRCVVFLDPPYPADTRKSQQSIYDFEMFGLDEHKQLLEFFITYRNDLDLLIATYQNPLYDQILSDFNMITYESMTRNGMRTEALYFNYDNPTELACYDYIGRDFIERQQILRMEQNLLSKLYKLPPLERMRMLNAIKNEFLKQE